MAKAWEIKVAITGKYTTLLQTSKIIYMGVLFHAIIPTMFFYFLDIVLSPHLVTSYYMFVSSF